MGVSTPLQDGSITTAKLAAASVTPDKLSGAQAIGAPVYGARAWVNFNGVGTVAIRASGNVSSITDNATGDYTVNFAVAMADANYSAVCVAGQSGAGIARVAGPHGTAPMAAGSFRLITGLGSTNALQDCDWCLCEFFR